MKSTVNRAGQPLLAAWRGFDRQAVVAAGHEAVLQPGFLGKHAHEHEADHDQQAREDEGCDIGADASLIVVIVRFARGRKNFEKTYKLLADSSTVYDNSGGKLELIERNI